MNAKLQGSSIVTSSSWTNFRSKPFASSSALVIMRRKAGIHEGDPAIACGDLKTIIILKKRLKMWASVNVEMLVETMSCDYLHDVEILVYNMSRDYAEICISCINIM
ncbi:hypothetical protein KL936_005443 [Ogataea polymorpha]|nr:hypothetical protein KL936_005443 [Ogataea polymorpha]